MNLCITRVSIGYHCSLSHLYQLAFFKDEQEMIANFKNKCPAICQNVKITKKRTESEPTTFYEISETDFTKSCETGVSIESLITDFCPVIKRSL